ncbi:MAG: hypothetical protein AB1641_09530 [Thermodesulfobacteriota bacterium]
MQKQIQTETRIPVKLSDLVTKQPEDVYREVERLCQMMFVQPDLGFMSRVFEDVLNLFAGKYPGYRECNTRFHDLGHTLDCYLALARLLHGASVEGRVFSQRQVLLALITSLFHDTGYIQKMDEPEGTGGQYTLVHVDRSIQFMSRYLSEKDLPGAEIDFCAACLQCTGLNVRLDKVIFVSRDHEILGKMVGTADLLGQMAGRTYLERLVFLFHEFDEAGVPGFESEMDLLLKTTSFYEMTQKRFADQLEGVNRWSRPHFRARWNIDEDLYQEAITRNMNYLESVLALHGERYRPHFRREGLLKDQGGRP